MLKDMFIFAIRNIKAYRKFFIQITVVLALILCLCSIYICSVSAIYNSYNRIQKENLDKNYVISIGDLSSSSDYNKVVSNYEHQLTKQIVYNNEEFLSGINKKNFMLVNNTFTLKIDETIYHSNQQEKEHNYYFRGIFNKYPMITKNDLISYPIKFDDKIFLYGHEPTDKKQIVLNSSFLSYYELDMSTILNKKISLIDSTSNYEVITDYEIVGIVSKNYTTDNFYLSSEDDYFSTYKNHFMVITASYFLSFDDAISFYKHFIFTNSTIYTEYIAADSADSVASLKKIVSFIQTVFILFIVILSASFLVTLVLKVDSIIYLQKTFLGVLITHGFERKKVDLLLWLQVFICGSIASIFAGIIGLIFVLFSKPLFSYFGVAANLSVGLFFLSLLLIFVLMIIILLIICTPMFIKLRKNDIIDYLR